MTGFSKIPEQDWLFKNSGTGTLDTGQSSGEAAPHNEIITIKAYCLRESSSSLVPVYANAKKSFADCAKLGYTLLRQEVEAEKNDTYYTFPFSLKNDQNIPHNEGAECKDYKDNGDKELEELLLALMDRKRNYENAKNELEKKQKAQEDSVPYYKFEKNLHNMAVKAKNEQAQKHFDEHKTFYEEAKKAFDNYINAKEQKEKKKGKNDENSEKERRQREEEGKGRGRMGGKRRKRRRKEEEMRRRKRKSEKMKRKGGEADNDEEERKEEEEKKEEGREIERMGGKRTNWGRIGDERKDEEEEK
ncbi:hypothetical protein niasHT_010236 [Heterodera trifolii]|uniref:Uncharacterized protein n=1 Tax=Heterodera trifolii TaxID=157864 RepID=A0ABD2LR19_9BILA